MLVVRVLPVSPYSGRNSRRAVPPVLLIPADYKAKGNFVN